MKTVLNKDKGFTIVELLIVIVTIAILAAITVIAYNGIQNQARTSKIKSDLATLSKAIQAARVNEGKALSQITGSSYSSNQCTNKAAGTDLATLPDTDTCWVNYNLALQKISDASGIDITGLVDPYDRPYVIDENEGVSGSCNRDGIHTYQYPFTGGLISAMSIYIPLSEFSDCL